MTRLDFVNRVIHVANLAAKDGARFNLAVLCAQAAHESGWGNSGLAVRANNLFGIKAGRSYKGRTIDLKTWEVMNGVRIDNVSATWRCYPDYLACVKDYAGIIARSRYFQAALERVDDSDAFLRCLLPAPGKPGWATDPAYFEKVRAVARIVESLGGPRWS